MLVLVPQVIQPARLQLSHFGRIIGPGRFLENPYRVFPGVHWHWIYKGLVLLKGQDGGRAQSGGTKQPPVLLLHQPHSSPVKFNTEKETSVHV